MSTDENNWRSPAFRQNVVAKIDEAVTRSGMPTTKNSMEMENHVFQKAKTREEYLAFVARLILHVREMSKEQKNSNAMGGGGVPGQMVADPLNALQHLARQGTGNNQMMGLNAGEMPGGPVGMRQPVPPNTATTLLQNFNQRPNPNQMMNIPGMQNKMGGIGMVPVQQGNPMGQMPVQQMNPQIHPSMQNQMGNQIPQMNMALGPQLHSQLNHMQQRKPGEMMMGNQPGNFLGPRAAPPNQFLRQSPSPSAVSPVGMGNVGSNQMAVSPALVPSPSGSQLTPVMSAGPPRSNDSESDEPSVTDDAVVPLQSVTSKEVYEAAETILSFFKNKRLLSNEELNVIRKIKEISKDF